MLVFSSPQGEQWRPASALHVLRSVGEGGAVLRGGVLRSVRSDVAQHHHNGAVRIHPLGHAEVVDAVVGDDVCQVVLWGEQTLAHHATGGWKRGATSEPFKACAKEQLHESRDSHLLFLSLRNLPKLFECFDKKKKKKIISLSICWHRYWFSILTSSTSSLDTRYKWFPKIYQHAPIIQHLPRNNSLSDFFFPASTVWWYFNGQLYKKKNSIPMFSNKYVCLHPVSELSRNERSPPFTAFVC